MKKQDFIFIGAVILFLLPFFVCPSVYKWYNTFNTEHGMIMSFFKFAILATTGEVIGLRITLGVYNRKGFGILPRALVWGILGMGISMAMKIFAAGTPAFLEYMGMEGAKTMIAETAFSWQKALVAFCIDRKSVV